MRSDLEKIPSGMIVKMKRQDVQRLRKIPSTLKKIYVSHVFPIWLGISVVVLTLSAVIDLALWFITEYSVPSWVTSGQSAVTAILLVYIIYLIRTR